MVAFLIGSGESTQERIRRLFLGFCLLQSASALAVLLASSAAWAKAGTWIGVAAGTGLVCYVAQGYRNQAFPAWDWLLIVPVCGVVLVATGYGPGAGFVVGVLSIRTLYGGIRQAAFGSAVAAVGIACVGHWWPTGGTQATTLGALAIVPIARLLSGMAAGRDKVATRREAMVAGGTGLMAAVDRRAAAEAALTAALALDARVVGAGVAVGKGSNQLILGVVERAAGRFRATNQRVDLAASLADGAGTPVGIGAALLAGAPARAFTSTVGLPDAPYVLMAPLCVSGDQFGLFALALGRRPGENLVGVVTTLAAHTAATLDRLLTVQRFGAVVGHSHDALLLATDDKIVRFANPAAQRLLSCSSADLCGRGLLTLLHPEDATMVPECGLDSADVLVRMCRMRALPDRQWVEVEIAIAHVAETDEAPYLVINVRDVSERARREVELRHAQKLASVGRLAAGIAHEINTPMHFIGENIRFLQRAFADLVSLHQSYAAVADAGENHGDPNGVLAKALAAAREAEVDLDVEFTMEEIPAAIVQSLEGIDRVSNIVRAMKTFGHPGGAEKAPANINDAINNTLVIVRNELKHVADVRTAFGDVPPVCCHIGDVSQIVLNLLVNAAHAISAAGSGRGLIGVTTRCEDDHVVIEVADSGTGIPADIADKVFEPFFTTKAVGTGTGQGLALVRTLVVDRHAGSIDFTTQPGEGTTFTVRLPTGDTHPPRPRDSESPPVQPGRPYGSRSRQ